MEGGSRIWKWLCLRGRAEGVFVEEGMNDGSRYCKRFRDWRPLRGESEEICTPPARCFLTIQNQNQNKTDGDVS